MASMCGGRLKYLRNGFTMLELTDEFDKWLIHVGNDVYMWGKWLKYLGNGQNIRLQYFRNG